VTAEEAMLPQGHPEKRNALGDAKRFLVNLLADAPVLTVKIQEEAKEANIAWRTIQRAKKSLNIKPCKIGMDEGWFWQLPQKVAKKHEDSQ
jgi:putative DNA primase/helicase